MTANVVVGAQFSLRRSNDQNAFSCYFQHGRIALRRKLLLSARTEPLLRENQILLALKNVRRRVVVAGKRFFQSVWPVPFECRQLSVIRSKSITTYERNRPEARHWRRTASRKFSVRGQP